MCIRDSINAEYGGWISSMAFRVVSRLGLLARSRGYQMSTRPKVVKTDCEQLVPFLDNQIREIADLVELPEFGTTEEQLVEACRDADVILHCYTPITAAVLEQAPKLRGIVKYGVGIDAIDIETAKRLGVPVANIPEYGEETVAEGAFSLMIGLAKKTKALQRQMAADGWAWPNESTLGSDLAGKTLGMVGNGRIGKCMARMAGGFRMNLLCYDPYVSAQEMAQQRITKVDSLEALCTESDCISVHTVLNNETRGVLGKAQLACMKPSATLVNVSRGPIVDEQALVDAVLSGSIAGVGIDVFGNEPLLPEGHVMSPLMELDNVLFTPHLAFWTVEARDRLMAEAFERTKELLDGNPLTVLSKDPRLLAQSQNVKFGGYSVASSRFVM
eukprot:TRINITY_DN18166_c0_g1_i1.p1 TRINITY_DN18166_c0_g1~~TRINITY_DN18166_c0_g1_i1.p1  ORF type:complete len:387 (+),score=68.23 TRINITY_DN18166_c0_g1_i1:89-1249(+)